MSNRQDDALPELPEPIYSSADHYGMEDSFTAGQMREYAQSAIASLQARLDAAERIVRSAHQELAPGGLYAGLQRDADRFLSGDF